MDEDGDGTTALWVLLAIVGYFVVGLGGCGYGLFSTVTTHGVYPPAEGMHGFGHWSRIGALGGAALGVLILAYSGVKRDGFSGLREVGRQLAVAVAAGGVAYMGFTHGLPFAFRLVGPNANWLLGVGFFVGALVLSVTLFPYLASMEIVEAIVVVPRTLFAQPKVLVLVTTPGILAPAAGCLVVGLIAAEWVTWRWEDLLGAFDTLLQLLLWGVLWATLVAAGGVLTKPRALRRSGALGVRGVVALAGAGLLWVALGGSALAGAAGWSANDLARVYRGSLEITSNKCGGSSYLLRTTLYSSVDRETLQCAGCPCRDQVELRARPGETIIGTVRSGNLVYTEDTRAHVVLAAKGETYLRLAGGPVHGRVTLSPSHTWMRDGKPPKRTSGRLSATVYLHVHVNPGFGVAYPKTGIRIRSGDHRARAYCEASGFTPDCDATFVDDDLRAGQRIELWAGDLFCLFGCDVLRRSYEVEGPDDAHERRSMRGMVATVDVHVARASPKAPRRPASH